MPHSFPTLRSSDLDQVAVGVAGEVGVGGVGEAALLPHLLDQARGEAATAEDVVHDIGGVVVWIVARDAFLAERHHRLWDRLGDHYRLALVLHLRLADLEGRGLFREREEGVRSEEHTSELQSLIRNSSAVFCLKKTKTQ